MGASPDSISPVSFDSTNFEKIISGQHNDPTSVLGPCSSKDSNSTSVVRAFLPTAKNAWIANPSGSVLQQMRRIHDSGLFQAECDTKIFQTDKGQYTLRYAEDGQIMKVHDPYAFPTLFKDLDLQLFGEGNHYKLYERMGAHRRNIEGVEGVNFSVWAPNARGVSLIGSMNNWDGRQHPMKNIGVSGIWELFVPGAQVGEQYKFRVTMQDGEQSDKSDPFGFYSELPPRTASVVADLNSFHWNDGRWMEKRANQDSLNQPISIYEVHLGSWRHKEGAYNGWLGYRELAESIVNYCREMGFTHVELMPITEHPYTGSWGYQTVGYFAATSRYGRPEDLMYFIDYCHQHDIGVIVDWVPAHFPKDGHGLARFDGTSLYEHEDPRQGYHPDWDTLIFNYERNEVRNFLIANALFWMDKYHVDGIRVDAVASMLYLDYSRQDGQWVPNKYGGRENLGAIDFLKQMNERVHGEFPGVLTIAEESTSWGGVTQPTYSGGLGFSIKWNMGWMNDTLRYMQNDPVHRKYHHDELTFSLIYAFSENFMLPFSHDEVVHGKGSLLDQMPGDLWQKFANLRLLYGYMWTHPGKKLIFMGSEWGQWNEWNCNASLQWDLLQHDSHRGIQKLISDLNRLYRDEPALHQLDFESNGFEWIDCHNFEASILSYLRRGSDPQEFLVCCNNFTPVPHHEYRLGVPEAGTYREIFNSDSVYYHGSNVGNGSPICSEPIATHGRDHSILLTIPPLATTILKKQ